MGAQSAGTGGGGGGTKPLKRLISFAFNEIFGFGKSLAVLWLPWAALVWAFIVYIGARARWLSVAFEAFEARELRGSAREVWLDGSQRK